MKEEIEMTAKEREPGWYMIQQREDHNHKEVLFWNFVLNSFTNADNEAIDIDESKVIVVARVGSWVWEASNA